MIQCLNKIRFSIYASIRNYFAREGNQGINVQINRESTIIVEHNGWKEKEERENDEYYLLGRLMTQQGKLIKKRIKQDSFTVSSAIWLIILKIQRIRWRYRKQMCMWYRVYTCLRVSVRIYVYTTESSISTRFPEYPALSSFNNNNNKKGWRPVLIRGSACLTWLTRRALGRRTECGGRAK